MAYGIGIWGQRPDTDMKTTESEEADARTRRMWACIEVSRTIHGRIDNSSRIEGRRLFKDPHHWVSQSQGYTGAGKTFYEDSNIQRVGYIIDRLYRKTDSFSAVQNLSLFVIP